MDPTAQAAFPCHVSPPIPGGPPNSGDPPADESGVYDPTVDELAYWRTPAWKRIVELLRRCECLPDDAVTAEAVRLSRFEPNLDPGDHRLLSELRRCATNVVLSLHKRKWSFGWLHSLCGKYLDNLDLLEEHIRRLPEAVPADSGVGLEWANDITAFWDIAPKVGGNRPPCPCPNDRTELKFREVKGEVRRLMDWCAGPFTSESSAARPIPRPVPADSAPPVPTAGGQEEGEQDADSPRRKLAVGLDADALALAAKLAGLPKRARVAYLQFHCTAQRLPDPTDRAAYDLLKLLKEDEQPESGLPALPKFQTWAKYLRQARAPLGEQKHKRRLKPAPADVRSAVPVGERT